VSRPNRPIRKIIHMVAREIVWWPRLLVIAGCIAEAKHVAYSVSMDADAHSLTAKALTGAAPQPILLRQIQKVAGGVTRLQVDFLSVEAGQVQAIIGPAGSGKVLLLQLLTGEATPTAGEVRVASMDPARQPAQLSKKIGVLYAQNGLYARQTARENLNLHCRLRGLPARSAEIVLTQVGLEDQAGVRASRLPPSLARQLAFGVAILHAPPVVILSEPFRDCDRASADILGRHIRTMAESGAAILILARDDAYVLDLAQRSYVLADGLLKEAITPEIGQPAELPFKVPARAEDRVILLNPADIFYAAADGDRVSLHTAAGPILTHLSLAELEQRLNQRGFFRSHRSYLVNLQHVKAVIPYTRDSFSLAMDDAANSQVPLSKSAARDLRQLIGY
jgi:ABC-2 type transport system ATP-binding protein